MADLSKVGHFFFGECDSESLQVTEFSVTDIKYASKGLLGY